MTQTGWNRREFVAAAALLASAMGIAPGVIAQVELDEADIPSARQQALMNDVAELVIPATDTPGAGEARVGDFVLLALAHGLNGSREALAPDAVSIAIHPFLRADSSLRYIDWLEDALNRAGSGDWLSRSGEDRAAALAALDAEAFGRQGGGHPWRMVKSLILTGYYTSEIGGSQELRYDPMPGRYDPAVPLQPGDRAYSNEWNGVEFG